MRGLEGNVLSGILRGWGLLLTMIREPKVAIRVNEKIVDGVEVAADVVVQ